MKFDFKKIQQNLVLAEQIKEKITEKFYPKFMFDRAKKILKQCKEEK